MKNKEKEVDTNENDTCICREFGRDKELWYRCTAGVQLFVTARTMLNKTNSCSF